MNGIEKITGRIGSDTERDVAEIQKRAEDEAFAISEGYRQSAETEYNQTVERGRRNAEERIERLAGVAGLDAKKLVLAARQTMIDRAFELALQKLTALPGEEYVSLLAKLAADSAENGAGEIVLSQSDRTRFGKDAVSRANELLSDSGKEAGLTLSEETRDIRGGLYLKNGRIENNCTFETILRLMRESISGEVAEVLFGS